MKSNLQTVNTITGASVSIESEKSKVCLGNATRVVRDALNSSLNKIAFGGGVSTQAPISLSHIMDECQAIITGDAKCVSIEPMPDTREYTNITVGGEVKFDDALVNLENSKQLLRDYLKQTTGVAEDGLSKIESILKNNPNVWCNPSMLNNAFNRMSMGVYKEEKLKYTTSINKKLFRISSASDGVDVGNGLGVISVLHESGLAKTSDEFNKIVDEFVSAAAKKYLPDGSNILDNKQNNDVIEDVENELYERAWKSNSILQNFLSFMLEQSFSYGRRYIESYMMRELTKEGVSHPETTQYFSYVYQLIRDITEDKVLKFSSPMSRRLGGGTTTKEYIEFDAGVELGINRLFYYLPICLHQPSAFYEKSKIFEWQAVSEKTTTLKTKVHGRVNHDFDNGVHYVFNNNVEILKLATTDETPYAIKILSVLDSVALLYNKLKERGIGTYIDDTELGLIRKYTREVLTLALANPFLSDGKGVDFDYKFYEFAKKGLMLDCPLLMLDSLSGACLYMYRSHTNSVIRDPKITNNFGMNHNIEDIFSKKIARDVINSLKKTRSNPIKVGLLVKVKNSIVDMDSIKAWNKRILGVDVNNLPELVKVEGTKTHEIQIGWSRYLQFECFDVDDSTQNLDVVHQGDGDYLFGLEREYTLTALDMSAVDSNPAEQLTTSIEGNTLPVAIVTKDNTLNRGNFLEIEISPHYFDDGYYKKNNKVCQQKLVMRDMCFCILLHLAFDVIKESSLSKRNRKISILRIHTTNNMNNEAFQACINATTMNSHEMMISSQGLDRTSGTATDRFKPLKLIPPMLKKITATHNSSAIANYCQGGFTVVAFLTVRTSYQKGMDKKHTLTCQAYFVNGQYFTPKLTVSYNETEGANSWWVLIDRLISTLYKHAEGLPINLKDIIIIHRLKNGRRLGYTGTSHRVLFDDVTLKNINEKYKDVSIIPLHLDENYFLADSEARFGLDSNNVMVCKDIASLDILVKDDERAFIPLLGYSTMKTVGNERERFYNSMNVLYADKKQLSQQNIVNLDEALIDALTDIFLLASLNESETRSVVMNPYVWMRPKESKYAGEVVYRNNGNSLTVNQAAICAAINSVALQSLAKEDNTSIPTNKIN